MPTTRTLPRRRSIPAAVAALALLLAACGGGDASPSSDVAEPIPAQIEIEGFAFTPNEFTVPVGTTVTFINRDSAPHTVTHGMDGSAVDAAVFDEQIAAGAEVTITFDEPGTYPITCTIHPSMNMTVTVVR